MLLISHRGNISGPDPEKENSPSYILEALKKYDVEIDVWLVNNEYFLGHDEPTYKVEESFLRQEGLWCHAKNQEALVSMVNKPIHCFWHQNDDVTLTSKNYLWTFPGKPIHGEMAIAVVPEFVNFHWDISKALGVCTDYINRY